MTNSTNRKRGRDLGIMFEGATGRHNAITDVAGVLVGYRTLVQGNGPLQNGPGQVRTGVTAILPHGHAKTMKPVFAGYHALNGMAR